MAHLTSFQRHKLEALYQARIPQQEIAAILGCHQSTVSRELRRSRPPVYLRYTARKAQENAEQCRQQSYEKRNHWYDNPRILSYVIEQLREGESPDAIAGRMQRLSPWHKKHAISHESIYRYIWRVKEEGGCLHLHLPRKGKRPKFYGFKKASASHIPNRRAISERPKIVDRKSRCGDWESDLIVSGRHGSGSIATFVERFSKYVQAILLENQSSQEFVRAARGVFSTIPEDHRLTMTHDNGSEICKHEQITKELKITVYCAEPYSSWQRGLNEHTNGLLRRFFPKGTDLSTVTEEELAKAVEKLNNRPRRSLRFLTPKEVFRWKIKDYAFQS